MYAHACREYRENLRYACRFLLTREEEASLLQPGELVGNLTMGDLEALYALTLGDRRKLAPPGYQPHH